MKRVLRVRTFLRIFIQKEDVPILKHTLPLVYLLNTLELEGRTDGLYLS